MRSEIHQLPEAFIDRLRKIVPRHKWDQVANTFAAVKPTTFRVNTLKASFDQVTGELQAKGFRFRRVGWYPDALILLDGRLRELQETDAYREGKIYVQNLSSMLPPLVLRPEPGDTVLDLTAAPGSKTTEMAALMGAQGLLVANDNNRLRFFKLKANVELQGAFNVELTMYYGEAFGRKQPERFDKVLLDAPCSAEGRFDVRTPSSYGYWKPRKVHEMAKKQKKLLFSAVQTLKPGGRLVYSTCTFAPEENEAVLDWALEKLGDTIELEPVKLPIPNIAVPLSEWEGDHYRPELKQAVRVLPTDEMEGFFVARILKKKSQLS